ncbi:RIN3 protein, partial [Atractosteus spatula]|nr:RIN3 protein [Atractosteus spatula]
MSASSSFRTTLETNTRSNHSEPTSPVKNQLVLPSISILEKLIKTCPVWLQLGISPERASEILQREPPGIFLVKKNANLKKMVLSVRFSDKDGKPRIQDILIKEEKSLLYLEGSVLVFDDIFKLIAFYCVSRDVLPFTLKLPQVIIEATKYEDMETISNLGSDFWGSSLNQRTDTVRDRSFNTSAGGLRTGQHFQTDASHCSCEIELSIGNDRLWYVNPIFIEEYCNSLPSAAPPITRSQSLNTPNTVQPRYKRPPPIPPRPQATEEFLGGTKEAKDKVKPNEESSSSLVLTAQKPECSAEQSKLQKHARIPPVPPRRRLSEKLSEEPLIKEEVISSEKKDVDSVPVATLICIEDTQMAEAQSEKALVVTKPAQNDSKTSSLGTVKPPVAVKKMPPIPPPRKKRPSQVTLNTELGKVNELTPEGSNSSAPNATAGNEPGFSPQTSSTPNTVRKSLNSMDLKSPDVSLFSPEGNPTILDHDSYSTSSTEEEMESHSQSNIKRNPTIMLDKAKQRLSMVNISHMFTSFLSADRKLQKKIVELARDKDSYFGNLVSDYKTFTLETMKKHSSSTEMLQEIRQMMTQLKSYLIQSAELQGLVETAVYTDEKLGTALSKEPPVRIEAIIEAALCKSVLKPIREAIYNGLKDIHTKDLSLKRLKDNQQVVLNTTTTDMGVTTSVPETPVMEKIHLKFTNLHKEYSPEKKIAILLKTCKIIYDSMSVGCPGKHHGADDFLPVLMYVLVRSNISAMLLDVEYMMELMDPALQLGEGSYYLTTTYGALEHIKNYDKVSITRQLSLEIQDSIHRWERRRTLNRARVSRTSVQDFINVSFLDAGCNTKTLGARPTTTVQDLCNQCAEKFEVLEPECYQLFVLVDGIYQQLSPDALPLTIKASFHEPSEPKKEYYFVYKPMTSEQEAAKPPPTETESLI